MDSLHVNSERGRFIGNLVNPSRGLRVVHGAVAAVRVPVLVQL